MNPILSLVTGTRNRPDDLRRLVASVAVRTLVPWELLIGDASDVPATCEIEGVRIIPERPRLGYTLGMNALCRQARGEYVLFLNDDAEVLPDYATIAVAFMNAYPAIGLGCLPYCEGSGGFRVNAYLGIPYANFGIIAKSLGDQIGWFDEDFPMYGSDNALAFRVLLANRGIAPIHGAHVLHYATDDVERASNNYEPERIATAERLARKYEPYMERMQSVYRATRSFEAMFTDQTPQFLRV